MKEQVPWEEAIRLTYRDSTGLSLTMRKSDWAWRVMVDIVDATGHSRGAHWQKLDEYMM